MLAYKRSLLGPYPLLSALQHLLWANLMSSKGLWNVRTGRRDRPFTSFHAAPFKKSQHRCIRTVPIADDSQKHKWTCFFFFLTRQIVVTHLDKVWLPAKENHNAHVACDKNEFDTPGLVFQLLLLSDCTCNVHDCEINVLNYACLILQWLVFLCPVYFFCHSFYMSIDMKAGI